MWVFLCLTSGKDLIVHEFRRLHVCLLQAEQDCRTASRQQPEVLLYKKVFIEKYPKLDFLPTVDKCSKTGTVRVLTLN